MADSLRDQLLALGFAKSKPQPEPQRHERRPPPPKHAPNNAPQNRQHSRPHGANHNRPQGGAPPAAAKSQSQAEVDLAKAYALRDRTEREERARAQREAEARAKEKKERKAKLTTLLAGKSLNDASAEHARHFPHGEKIRRIYVTPEQLTRLNLGELGVVQLAGRYMLVDRETALAAQAVAAEAMVLLPDPNAPVEDDIPADLTW